MLIPYRNQQVHEPWICEANDVKFILNIYQNKLKEKKVQIKILLIN